MKELKKMSAKCSTRITDPTCYDLILKHLFNKDLQKIRSF